MSAKYYPVDEDAARRAEEMNGSSDYVPGSAAAVYHRYVDAAIEIAERQKRHVGPEHHERIDHLLDMYARKLAENMNDSFTIEACIPKLNYAREKNMAERQAIQNLLDKIRGTGIRSISAYDPTAVPKLEQELAEHLKLREHMKSANAYFRRHRTLEGCPNMSPERIRSLTEDSVRLPDTPPYLSFQLTSIDARIGYLRERIQELTRQREPDYTGWEFEGGEVEVNQEEDRLLVLFNSNIKPGLSAKSIKNIHGILHSALQQAVAVGYIRSNPTDVCTLPKVIHKELKPLDEDATTLFIEAIEGHRYEVVFLVTLFTGMRQGEVLGLTWDCVDFTRGTVTINKQLQKTTTGGSVYVLVPTKNGKGRVIAPAPDVMDLLRTQKQRQAEWKSNAGPLWEDSNLAITDELGKHFSHHTVYQNFKRVVASIGFPDVRFHDLRHPNVKPKTQNNYLCYSKSRHDNIISAFDIT